MGTLKMRDWKMLHRVAGLENSGQESMEHRIHYHQWNAVCRYRQCLYFRMTRIYQSPPIEPTAGLEYISKVSVCKKTCSSRCATASGKLVHFDQRRLPLVLCDYRPCCHSRYKFFSRMLVWNFFPFLIYYVLYCIFNSVWTYMHFKRHMVLHTFLSSAFLTVLHFPVSHFQSPPHPLTYFKPKLYFKK